MKRSSGSRKIGKLSISVSQQLNAYALAASAAGVSLIALVQAAEAKIVYTKTNKVLYKWHDFASLDLNHDGVVDFNLLDRHWTSIASTFGRLTVDPAGRSSTNANEIWGKPCRSGFPVVASALPPGIRVGPKGRFSHGFKLMKYTYFLGGARNTTSRSCFDGLWNNVSNRYLGLKFIIKGKIHFGWARLSVSSNNEKVAATLTGYAYETIPGKPIITGETKGEDDSGVEQPSLNDPGPGASRTNPIPYTAQPASLGRLALGAPGATLRRRAEKQALEGN